MEVMIVASEDTSYITMHRCDISYAHEVLTSRITLKKTYIISKWVSSFNA